MLAIASGTRGSWVALLIGALVVLCFCGRSGRRWMRWQVGALTGGGAVYLFFIIGVPDWLAQPAAFMHRVDDIPSLLSLRGRDELWQLSADLIAQNPWLGIGPMHFADHLSVLAAHPHNAIIQFMVEWGVPAALGITVVWVAGGLVWSLHVRRMTSTAEPDRQSMVLAALLAAITGASAQAMVDGVMVMPVSQTLLALLCGWALGDYVSEKSPQASQGSSLALRGSIVAAVAVLAWSVMPELGRLEARMQAHMLMQPEGPMPNPKLLPRFWIQGWID
jgi:O-antigen ligase